MTGTNCATPKASQWTIGLLVGIAGLIVGGVVTWLAKLDDRTWQLNTHLSRIEATVETIGSDVKDIKARLRDDERRRLEELRRPRSR